MSIVAGHVRDRNLDRRIVAGCEVRVGRRLCRGEVVTSWGVCALVRNGGYIVVCAQHDVELNAALMRVVGVPNVDVAIDLYRREHVPQLVARKRELMARSA